MTPISPIQYRYAYPVLLILLFSAERALAALHPPETIVALIWTGATSTNWDDPANWSPNAVPTADDELTIPNVTNDPIVGNGTTATAKTITVEQDAELTIASGGSLSIVNPGFVGLGNLGTVSNAGTLQITGSDNVAIDNSGTLINAGGQINLLNGSNSVPLASSGSINNQNGGSIYISGSQMGEAGIYLTGGSFSNSGAIQVTMTSEGISLASSSATFTNSGGTIDIDDVLFTGVGVWSGTFNNTDNGQLNIDGVDVYGGLEITTGTFNNRSGSEVNIDNIGANGLDITGGALDNESVINIGQNGGIGQNGIYATVSFSNDNGASINIDNTGARGFYLQNTFFTFNEGAINIGRNGEAGSITTTGLETTQSGNYINYGQIHIDNTGEHGLLVNNQFTNADLLTIGTNGPIGLDGIRHVGNTLTNNSCSIIELHDNLHSTATISNSGWMLINTSDAHTNSATFTNEGGLFMVQTPDLPGVTNEEIIVRPIVSDECESISPAFDLGASVDLTILGIFSDADGTISAGNYNIGTNVFTPDPELFAGIYEFYVSMEDPSTNCTSVFPWVLTLSDCGNEEPCTDDEEVMVDYPISDTQTLRSGDFLTASSTIESTADVVLTAANVIIFEPGFSVENGASLHAFIAGCTFSDNLQVAVDETKLKTAPLQPLIEELKAEVFPNPVRTQTTIKFYLPVPGNLDVAVHDRHGRLLYRRQYTGADAGWQQTAFSVNNLPAGTYLLYLVSEGQQIVRQLVVQR